MVYAKENLCQTTMVVQCSNIRTQKAKAGYCFEFKVIQGYTTSTRSARAAQQDPIS